MGLDSDNPDKKTLHPYEWQLWRIPEKDRPVALWYEAAREFYHTPEVKARNPPWLRLSKKSKKSIRALVNFPAVQGIPNHESQIICRQATRPTQDEGNSISWLDSSKPGDPKNCLGGKKISYEVFSEQGWKVQVKAFAFYLNTSASRRELQDAFRDWLETNNIGSAKSRKRGRSDDTVFTRLRDLSLRRLRKIDPNGEYWKPLSNTDFSTWDRNIGPKEIRAITETRIRKLEEIYKSMGWYEPPVPE